ncbi:MAG: GNAT superfamily N-acetyltransferase [Akkermansiaceae bacterium]|jgi:GNAT superfamily N-acetyltransferase
MTIRELGINEWDKVASLIFHSTNQWYLKKLNRGCFPGEDPSICRIFPEVYEKLDPGCCLVAEIDGEFAGSCFYHPRETHVSLGIMNANPKFTGQGVARNLLDRIIQRAGTKPVRLVSSALNLDSYSLYTRAGFRPLAIYQDMFLPAGKPLPPPSERIRPATLNDIPALMNLEEQISGIRREKDWRYFLSDDTGVWRGLICENEEQITGALFSINHPGSRMLGPGIMVDEDSAFDLITAHLNHQGQDSLIFLVPAAASHLVNRLYSLGARNCEIHLSQVRGETQEPAGIVMPTFMPETG